MVIKNCELSEFRSEIRKAFLKCDEENSLRIISSFLNLEPKSKKASKKRSLPEELVFQIQILQYELFVHWGKSFEIMKFFEKVWKNSVKRKEKRRKRINGLN